MIPLTTPKHTFKLPFDPASCEIILVTYFQGKIVLERSKDSMSIDSADRTVSYRLSQQETKLFNPKSDVEIQMRVVQNGNAFASDIYKEPVKRILNTEVLGDEDEM